MSKEKTSFSYGFPEAAPAETGVEPQAVLKLLDVVEEKNLGIHGMVLLRHGHVIASGWYSPYRADQRHMLFSLTKSFTGMAVGFAVQEGLLCLDDPAAGFFPELLPAPPCEYMREVTVRNLLSMSSGHSKEPDGDAIQAFLTSYVDQKPGSLFTYNTPGSCVLSAIVQKAAGMTTEEYLRPRLFEPLGITDYVWDQRDGVSLGGFGLNLRAMDIAKFGQFLLQKGMWNGKQLISPEWIEAATTPKIMQLPADPDRPDWHSGYGYQFWMCAREGAFRGDGAFGQLCVVFPGLDMILAVTAGVEDMQEELNIFFDSLLPGCHKDGKPIPAGEETQKAQAELEKRLASLSLPSITPDVKAAPAGVGEKSGSVYRLSSNLMNIQEIAFAFGENEDTLSVVQENRSFSLKIGHEGTWIENFVKELEEEAAFHLNPLSCTSFWDGRGVYRLRVAYIATPFVDDMEIRFDGGVIEISRRSNVGSSGKPRLIFGREKA